MNLSKLKENLGERLRLRPPAIRQRVGGTFDECDDLWTLEKVERDRIRLVNERTRQSVELARDHLHHYISGQPDAEFDGFLELSVRIDITPEHPVVTPIPSGPARNVAGQSKAPLKVRLAQLLNRVNPDILRVVEGPHRSVAVMMGAANLQVLNELRQEPGFDELISVRPNGNMCIGTGHRVGGHIHDHDTLGSLHGVELTIKSSLDWHIGVRGLKENVTMGRLIPAGTGFEFYRHVAIPPDEPPPPPAQPTDDNMEFGPEMEYFAEPEETLRLGAHGIEPVQ